MTDRYQALTVVLERDVREDDAEATIAAIRQLKGVLTVGGDVTDPTDFVAMSRARKYYSERLWSALKDDKP